MDKEDFKTRQEQYNEMKKKHPDAIILFGEGAFYNLYGEDAETAAPLLGLNLTTAVWDSKVKTCGFDHLVLGTYLRKLVRAGKRVAICERPETDKKIVKRGV